MDSEAYRCRAKIFTDEQGAYWYKTIIPPPYAKRPKHIHYLVHQYPNHQKLVTQLYFKGDKRIEPKNWITHPWDKARILDVFKDEHNNAMVNFDLYLSAKS